MSKFVLVDDGTMDTVLECTGCGKEVRYTYDSTCENGFEEATDFESYHEFVDWAIEDAEESHECEEDDA